MRFFFPDAQDFIDPGFDFDREAYSPGRVRQRDDRYAHEVFDPPPYDGLLVSRAIVEGVGAGAEGKYTDAQRHRLLRVGAREFFRLPAGLQVMGDCGAFSYVREPVPPVTPDGVIDFYEACGFDAGAAVDHVILGYDAGFDRALPGLDPVPADWRERQRLTLELAGQFRRRHTARGCRFEPLGVAQGWSPASYAACVAGLQRMGYRRIALGGMVPLRSAEVLDVLKAVDAVRKRAVGLHLFGVTRFERAAEFARHGVTSFDSTSPLKQAFMDDRDNYHAPARTYVAVRVPQVDKNPKLKGRILAGEVDQADALRLERACLAGLAGYDRGEVALDDLLERLAEYEQLHDGKRDRTAEYRQTLGDRPWRACPCAVCRTTGVNVVVFRGAERNRRRGFHNVWQLGRRLRAAGPAARTA